MSLDHSSTQITKASERFCQHAPNRELGALYMMSSTHEDLLALSLCIEL